MSVPKSVNFRPVTNEGAQAAKDLFELAYGKNYPFVQFCDRAWMTKVIFNNGTLFPVTLDRPHGFPDDHGTVRLYPRIQN